MSDAATRAEETSEGHSSSAIGLMVGAVGVCYGDIGTSPLYTLKEVFIGGYGVQANHDGVLGVLSLIFWSLVWVVSINYQVIARIDQDACIGCGRCHIACEDTSHQAIASLPRADGTHRYEVIDAECVGCNLCQITCPVENCIEMVPQDTGKPYLNWTQDPRNPYREASKR